MRKFIQDKIAGNLSTTTTRGKTPTLFTDTKGSLIPFAIDGRVAI